MSTISGYLNGRNIFTQLIDCHDDVLHNHAFVEIFYVTDGTAQHFCNGKTTALNRGSIGFLRPFDQHMYIREPDVPCVHRDILISLESFQMFCNNLAPSLFPIFINSKQAFFFELTPRALSELEKIFSSFTAHPQATIGQEIIPKESWLISHMVNLWFSNLIYEQTITPTWFKTLINKLSNPDYFDLSLSEIIEQADLFYDRASLSRMFKKHAGCSMINYSITAKINHAASLLTFTPMPITDVARQSGFSSVTYFNKLFKRFWGISPTKYRTKTRETGISREKRTAVTKPVTQK